MKGLVLAGGSGTRLHPITKGVSKHLLPVYDKPMIYYPISVLMLAGIREILIITTKQDQNAYQRLLGNGKEFGVEFHYEIQDSPKGIAEAFIIGESFIGSDDVALILGDNIFYGQGFTPLLQSAITNLNGATVFAYQVKNPSQFGVVEFDEEMRVISIEEKPEFPKSNFSITGLYFYDNNVINIAKKVMPSERGEIEITSINNAYLEQGNISVEVLGRGFAWLDTGNHSSLLEAGSFVQTLEQRQGLKLACLEEIAFNHGWLNINDLNKTGRELINTSYGQYLLSIAAEHS